MVARFSNPELEPRLALRNLGETGNPELGFITTKHTKYAKFGGGSFTAKQARRIANRKFLQEETERTEPWWFYLRSSAPSAVKDSGLRISAH
jgi:hypothetical protein